MQSLPPVVEVDPDKCVNCHACITACPVKHCNDGSGDHVEVNHDTCIACGACVQACHHQARRVTDDTERFLADLGQGVRIVAIVAPAVAAVFPDRYLCFNGWLRSLGVKGIYDVAYGAELTVLSYLHHIERNRPQLVIAQPCPAIVSYIELYRPELLPHLAPADSPMLHTAKLIRRYYPAHKDCRIAVMSPCGAKRREFAETGIGDYNVTFNALIEELKRRNATIEQFPEVDYDNPPAERAVLFSTPGGLLQTALRWRPDAGSFSRKIEGQHTIYHYLDHLAESLKNGEAPLLVDCLNCELGCNGGPGTPNQGGSPDHLEAAVARRAKAMRKHYGAEGGNGDEAAQKRIRKLIEPHWDALLYQRTYVDRSANVRVVQPNEAEFTALMHKMEKTSKEDELDCGGCGYGKCREMAVAIHNGLNQPANCHFYKRKRIEALALNASEMKRVGVNALQLGTGMEEMGLAISEISRHAQNAIAQARAGAEQAEQAVAAMKSLHLASDEISKLASSLSRIAAQTQTLSLNATIAAARAGDAGRGFGVVANEVRELAHLASDASSKVNQQIAAITAGSKSVNGTIEQLRVSSRAIEASQVSIAGAVEQQVAATKEMTKTVEQIAHDVDERIKALADYAAASGMAIDGIGAAATPAR